MDILKKLNKSIKYNYNFKIFVNFDIMKIDNRYIIIFNGNNIIFEFLVLNGIIFENSKEIGFQNILDKIDNFLNLKFEENEIYK